MFSQAVAEVGRPDSAERFRQAERALWGHYGLAANERFVDVRQPAARIRVVEVGAGRPLLVVHGTFGSGPAFAALARELPGSRLLLMDRPGFGLSSPIAYRAETFGMQVADLGSGVLDGLDLDQVDVVGHSIGALFALRLALHHPERVRRVVLLGAGPIVQDAGVPTPIRLVGSPLGPVMVGLMRRPAVVRSMIRASGHGAALADGRIPQACIDWRVAVNRETDSMWHERAMVRAIVDGSRYRSGITLSDADLAAIRQPTLMIYGTADQVGSMAVWRRVMATLRDGRLTDLEGAGHMVWLDDPAGVARQVEAFVAD